MRVGVVGLGAMGSAMAQRLVMAKHTVLGTDPKEACLAELEHHGGRRAATAAEVAAQSDIVITSLNSAAVFEAVTTGPNGLLATARPGLVVVDTCTLAIADKQRAADALATKGAVLLDCTVSGTRPLVLDGILALYASGPRDAFERAEPALASFTKTRVHLGAFGNATRLKCVLNLLVMINNAATAEAMTLARRSGLDLDQVWSLVADSFAGSGVWRSRGRMMVDRDYTRARGTYGIARKDAGVISDFAADNLVPTPLFHAALEMHRAGMALGYTENDTASLFEVYGQLAGLDTVPPAPPLI